MPTRAELLIAALYRHGVRVIFGMPGSHTTSIYDALERHGGIRTILIRNEQAGAFAADGFARVTGQPGVICTTAGPGATNALTGIAETWADSVPLLLLSGQVNAEHIGVEVGNYHEIDLENIFRPCTKYVATLRANDDIDAHVACAFHALTTGRPRPAALILPQDLMAEPSPDRDLERPELPSMATEPPGVYRAVALLSKAKRPILLVGGGALGAAAEVHRLAERLPGPVITTLNGKGLIDERDPLSLGHARSVRARFILPHADLMVAVGCRFTEVMTGFRQMHVPDQLIHIDIDGSRYSPIDKLYAAEGVVADARATLRRILERLPAKVHSDWGETWAQARQVVPKRREWLIDTLRAELPEDAIVFTDASEMAYRMHTDYPAYRARSFFYPSNYIALGWGFPAALGAAVALPDRVVVSMSGDDGFVMTCQELATAARYGLRLIAVIHNDSAYGAIKNLQRLKYEGRYRDTDLNNPDFVKLAEAYGVPALRVRDAEGFAGALRQAIERGGPAVIEVVDEWRYLRA